MDPVILGAIILFGLLALILLGVHVAVALGFVGLVILYFSGGTIALGALGTVAFTNMSNYVLTAVPLFILMGDLLFRSGIGKELYDVGSKWLGHLPGGLAMGSVAACAVFGAVSGASVAGVATIGVNAVPQMRERGYHPRLAAGSVTAAGALAMLIPPSIPFLLYSVVTEESVGKLFIAGIIPGIMLALFMIIQIWITVALRPGIAPRLSKVPLKDRLVALKDIWTAMVLIILVLGGIYTGFTTPTEAAAVGVAGSILVGLLKRSLTWSGFKQALVESTNVSVMILTLLVSAFIFAYGITIIGVPQAITAWVSSLQVSPLTILILINILLVFLGMFMEVSSIMLITLPILYPLIQALNFDPIWFGVIMVLNLEMGVITPPVGMNLYVMKGIAKDLSLGEIISGTLPFVIAEALAIAVIIAYPPLATWLPSMVK